MKRGALTELASEVSSGLMTHKADLGSSELLRSNDLLFIGLSWFVYMLLCLDVLDVSVLVESSAFKRWQI